MPRAELMKIGREYIECTNNISIKIRPEKTYAVATALQAHDEILPRFGSAHAISW